VRPDGRGLPDGRGSVAEGQAIYDAKCASCHGTFGESNDYMALAGGVGTLASDQPQRTLGSKLNHATTLFDYIRRAMPFNAPQSLTSDEVYALTAYVLNLNDIVPADATLDRASILAVKMPNRDGFTTDHGFMTRDGKPDTHNVACMTNCGPEARIASRIPDYARDDHGDLAAQTARSRPARRPRARRPRARPPISRSGRRAWPATPSRPRSSGPSFRDVAAKYAGRRGGAGEARRAYPRGRRGKLGGCADAAHPPARREADALALAAGCSGGAPP
jgi:cytochrome c